MKCVNLAVLAQISENEAKEIFTKYESLLSDRIEELRFDEKEFEALKKLVLGLKDFVSYKAFDNFAYSYSIPQISKEFDLLKITTKSVLNIELKSEKTDKVLRQLQRNFYYLKALSMENLFLFTYIAETNEVLFFDGEKVRTSSITELAEIINFLQDENAILSDFDVLFSPKKYLISPFNTPDRFLDGEYFLNDQQENIKNEIIFDIGRKQEEKCKFYRILGEAGTGKTLLLYDIAKELSLSYNVCLVHCGLPNEGLEWLKGKIDQLSLLTIKESMLYIKKNRINVLILDESHRLYVQQFDYIINLAEENKWVVIFGIDPEQTLSQAEIKANIFQRIDKLSLKKKYVLSKKIRTNKEIAEFIRILGNLNWQRTVGKFSNVFVVPAYSYEQADKLIFYFQNEGYTYISYTMSRFYSDPLDQLAYNKNTHEVIGQEFDKVLMVLDDKFYYGENNHLMNSEHPNPNYVFGKLLFQGLTRTREKLALIIINNHDLFKKIVSAITPYGE